MFGSARSFHRLWHLLMVQKLEKQDFTKISPELRRKKEKGGKSRFQIVLYDRKSCFWVI